MYVSLADVRSYLAASETGDDALLTMLITNAQAIIDKVTARTFEVNADTTRYFDAVADVRGGVLYFDTDICSITSISNAGSSVASTQYVTMPRNVTPYYGIRLKDDATHTWKSTSTASEDAISVTGKWGYSTTPPSDIAQACLRLTAYLYRQRENANDLDRAVVVGNATVLPTRLPQDVAEILLPYRRLT